MFALSESLGAIQKLFFFNDKELPMGSKSERLVSQFLELSDNPKGNSAYNLFSTMSEENPIVITGINDVARVTQLQHFFTNYSKDLSEIGHFVDCYFECLKHFDFKTDAFSFVSQVHYNRFGFYAFSTFKEFKNKLV